MSIRQVFQSRISWCLPAALWLLSSCGGGTGNERDSGAEKTLLSVEAHDADGDTLSYQWRVTAGSVENRNARETVWTLPQGPGLHFAYVMVSDGRGGYAEQQYAASTDALGTSVPSRAAIPEVVASAASTPTADGVALRVRVRATDPSRQELSFTADGGVNSRRHVYLPDVPIQATVDGTTHSGTTDLSGEFSVPHVRRGATMTVQCASYSGAPTTPCSTSNVSTSGASVIETSLDTSRFGNVRLHGHVALRDGGVCGNENEFFGMADAATVQLYQDGRPLAPPRRVNRFGDYAIDGPGLVASAAELRVRCGSHEAPPVTIQPPSGGFIGTSVLVPAVVLSNARPTIARMVANGPDGNVRGRMVVPEPGAASNGLPGPRRFLAYKGTDNAKSACEYYRSIGAVKSCDAQGRMQQPLSLDDWKRQNWFAPYAQGNTEVAATYINRRDLNLVRRMVATQKSADSIAFYVCNSPGPEGGSQAEVDEVIRVGVADERRVACVAMEWSRRGGVFGGNPFTKFYTFGPDGALIPSVNLDGRGEKYMPGTCVACHGGTEIGGRFPDSGTPSPLLGARFLPFDMGTYAFSTHNALTSVAQEAAFRSLNKLVVATELSASSPTNNLYNGWYGRDETTRQRDYVPPAWVASASAPDAPDFYQLVIARSCRTCHVALGAFDWDSFNPAGFRQRVEDHACGGTPSLAVNASMPNALASLDRLVADQGRVEPRLASLMEKYLGCAAPKPDPVHARR